MVRKRGISPKLDLVFKKIFGDKKNSDILSDFLSAVLGVTDIESIEILDNEMISDVFVEKFSRLDLRINLNGNTSINVEIQVKNYENYKDRTLFYWSKLYTQGFKEGQDYAELKETIAINILDFNLFDCEEYHSVFGVFEETRREKLSDKFRIDFLELKKAKKFKEMNGTMATRKQMWMDFLNATSDDDETLSRLSDSTTNPVNSQAVGKAVAVLKKMSADEKTLYEIEAREKMLHDEASARSYERNQGRMEGLEQGRKEGREEGAERERKAIIERLKKNGFTDEQIAEILK